MTGDRPVLGIFLMIGFCFIAPLADGVAKLAGQSLDVSVIVLARFVFQALLLVPLTLFLGKSLRIPAGLAMKVVVRTAMHVGGSYAMILSLLYLPLADALAIAYVLPFLMLLLGRFVLNEFVGPYRLAACIAGFAGTLLVIQPSFADVGWPALLPLLVAVSFAVFILVTRQIAKEIDPIALQGVSGVIATPMVIAVMLLFGPVGTAYTAMSDWTWQLVSLLFVIGVLSTIGQLLMTWSLRFVPSATVAPVQYLEIPFAVLIGWVMFQDLPNGLAAVGIVISITAGMLIILREKAIARQMS